MNNVFDRLKGYRLALKCRLHAVKNPYPYRTDPTAAPDQVPESDGTAPVPDDTIPAPDGPAAASDGAAVSQADESPIKEHRLPTLRKRLLAMKDKLPNSDVSKRKKSAQRRLWMQLGVTVEITPEEEKALLRTEAIAGEVLQRIVQERRFYLDGVARVPSFAISEYNRKDGTNYLVGNVDSTH